MLKSCLLLIFLFLLSFSVSADVTVCKEFNEVDCVRSFDSLSQLSSTNKSFEKQYELQSLVALSYFPELKDVHIAFRYANIKTTMETRPTVVSALLPGQRKYVIFIDNDSNDEGVLLQDVPFNAQVGIIGHELCHILDYESRNTLGLLGLTWSYLTNKVKHAAYERRTDLAVIEKGLGWQLEAWADFVFNKSKASVEYKRFKWLNYLRPVEIQEEITRYDFYSFSD